MTPQEKAKELVSNYTYYLFDNGHRINKPMVIQCAIIAVDEIIKAGEDVDEFADDYYQQIKTELQKL